MATTKMAQALANMSVVDAADTAEKTAIAKDQIWGGEGYTKYTFDDNSVLIQSGTEQYGMDADSVDSINGYKRFLGKDAPIELAEIERLIECAQ